jgi:uncharacterized Zn finger protein
MYRGVELPGSIYLECPECGEETLHEVLKGRASDRGTEVRLSALVKCPECGAIYRVNLREGGERAVNAIVSDLQLSQKLQIPLDPASTISLDDIIMVEGLPCIVTSIEVGGRRPGHARVPEITTIWLKRYDKLRVKVSINAGRSTVTRELWAAPEEEFEVGDVLNVQDMKVLVHAIKVPTRKLHRGSAKAKDIRRLYGREVD